MYNLIKRTIDIGLSLLLIILTFPIQLIIAVILFITIKENPLFLHSRGLTLNKFRFTMVKFRTIGASQIKKKLHPQSKNIFLMPGPEVYLNTFANWLRKTGLDELPQIYNVFVGEMSFIGPRPLMIQDLEILKNNFPIYYKLRETIASKPGITGIWQIIGDRSHGAENLVSLDLFYEKKRSSILDVIIFFSTIPIILFAKNSDALIPSNNFIRKFFTLSLKYFRFIPSREIPTGKHESEEPKTY
jgi:lipopolysaccharide/colanic/teichoic acid biosynthesis glycosyltransferase